MKKFTVLIILVITSNLFGQNSQLPCYEFMKLEENKNFCDTTVLENGAKIYYNWNCDSTWLTFENDKKTTLKSCADLDPITCSRIGLNFIKEYPNYLLFSQNWASSGSWSPDIVFIDKSTGIERNRIDKDRFIWGDAEENYTLYFNDSTFRELIYLDHQTDKLYSYPFKENVVKQSIEKKDVIQINRLFKDFILADNHISFSFINDKNETEKISFKVKE